MVIDRNGKHFFGIILSYYKLVEVFFNFNRFDEIRLIGKMSQKDVKILEIDAEYAANKFEKSKLAKLKVA